MINRSMRQVVLFAVFMAGFSAASAEPPESYKTRFPVSAEARARQFDHLELPSATDDRLVRGLRRRDWPSVRSAFLQTALQQAKRCADLSEGFWQWIESNHELSTAVLAGAAPNNAGMALKRLSQLRELDPKRVDLLPHLAVAFALVWASADDPADGSFLRVKLRPDCPVPPMEESFEYYAEHAEQMLIPLNYFQWPLLVNVADIDVPISERLFLLSLFQDTPKEPWARAKSRFEKDKKPVWHQVAITDGSKPKPTMQNIFEFGGMCKRQSYFQSRASKSLGIPSPRVYDLPMHVCPSRMTMIGSQWGLSWQNRRYAGHYVGSVKDPGRGCRQIPVHHYEMLVDACNLGYERLIDAILATAISDLLPPENESFRRWLLELSIDRNPYWVPAWGKLAALAGPEGLPDLIGSHQRLIKEHPDVLFSVMQRAMNDPERFSSGGSQARRLLPAFDYVGNYFAGATDHLAREGRPDLCSRAALLRCEYLAAIDRREEAIDACGDALFHFSQDMKTGLPQVIGRYGDLLSFLWFQLNRAGRPGDYADLVARLTEIHADAFHKTYPKSKIEDGGRLYALLTAQKEAAARADNPLMAAASAGQIRSTQRLVARWKSYLNDTDMLGRSALMQAASAGRPHCIHVLLEAGADRDATDASGMTALDHATTRKKSQAMRLLQEEQN